jgi:phospholipase/lecithinase/hemolysin
MKSSTLNRRANPLALATRLAGLLIQASPARSDTFDRIVVFGDSLSDVGNVSDLTFGVAPGASYFQG